MFFRAAIAISSIWLISSCSPVSRSLHGPRTSAGTWALGTGVSDYYGLWAPSYFYGDERLDVPADTSWTLIFRNPTELVFNDQFLIAKNRKGRTLIKGERPDNKDIWKSTRSSRRYLELRKELGIPDTLELKPILQ